MKRLLGSLALGVLFLCTHLQAKILLPKPKEVLVLYDDAGPYGYMGKEDALLLRNLLGHFKGLDIDVMPAKNYTSGDMNGSMAVFYLGTTFDAPAFYAQGSKAQKAYADFFKDAATLGKTVVWMNYNLWRLQDAWNKNGWGNGTMQDTIGISYDYYTGIPYNRVTYKNTELYKGVVSFENPGANVGNCFEEIVGNRDMYDCEPVMMMVKIVDQSKVKVYATASSTFYPNRKADPYIVKAGNFWFVGDIPFSYMSEEDRYLAFADLLHDMLKIYHKEHHTALMRLEDVDARTDTQNLLAIANAAQKENVFFSVATIAKYVDPNGVENNGVPTEENLTGSNVAKVLQHLQSEGRIAIVAHGFTHQLGNMQNPYNGVSGDDFEFMRVVENPDHSLNYLKPAMNDSGLWAYLRMHSAKSMLQAAGLQPFAWEAPHYAAGPSQYRAIREVFPVQYARMQYYPFETSTDPAKRFKSIGQFFPYLINSDAYGYTVIPENIGYVEIMPNAGYRALYPEDIIRFAQKLKVVRDSVASFYYHPYLGADLLPIVIKGLKAAGYTFVSPSSLLK